MHSNRISIKKVPTGGQNTYPCELLLCDLSPCHSYLEYCGLFVDFGLLQLQASICWVAFLNQIFWISFILIVYLEGKYHQLHFTDEKTVARTKSDLLINFY